MSQNSSIQTYLVDTRCKNCDSYTNAFLSVKKIISKQNNQIKEFIDKDNQNICTIKNLKGEISLLKMQSELLLKENELLKNSKQLSEDETQYSLKVIEKDKIIGNLNSELLNEPKNKIKLNKNLKTVISDLSHKHQISYEICLKLTNFVMNFEQEITNSQPHNLNHIRNSLLNFIYNILNEALLKNNEHDLLGSIKLLTESVDLPANTNVVQVLHNDQMAVMQPFVDESNKTIDSQQPMRFNENESETDLTVMTTNENVNIFHSKTIEFEVDTGLVDTINTSMNRADPVIKKMQSDENSSDLYLNDFNQINLDNTNIPISFDNLNMLSDEEISQSAPFNDNILSNEAKIHAVSQPTNDSDSEAISDVNYGNRTKHPHLISEISNENELSSDNESVESNVKERGKFDSSFSDKLEIELETSQCTNKQQMNVVAKIHEEIATKSNPNPESCLSKNNKSNHIKETRRRVYDESLCVIVTPSKRKKHEIPIENKEGIPESIVGCENIPGPVWDDIEIDANNSSSLIGSNQYSDYKTQSLSIPENYHPKTISGLLSVDIDCPLSMSIKTLGSSIFNTANQSIDISQTRFRNQENHPISNNLQNNQHLISAAYPLKSTENTVKSINPLKLTENQEKSISPLKSTEKPMKSINPLKLTENLEKSISPLKSTENPMKSINPLKSTENPEKSNNTKHKEYNPIQIENHRKSDTMKIFDYDAIRTAEIEKRIKLAEKKPLIQQLSNENHLQNRLSETLKRLSNKKLSTTRKEYPVINRKNNNTFKRQQSSRFDLMELLPVTRENLIMERMTKQDLCDMKITQFKTDSISGTKRKREDSQMSANNRKVTELSKLRNIIQSKPTEESKSISKLLNVNLGQYLLRHQINEEDIIKHQRLVTFTAYNPMLPEPLPVIKNKSKQNRNEIPIEKQPIKSISETTNEIKTISESSQSKLKDLNNEQFIENQIVSLFHELIQDNGKDSIGLISQRFPIATENDAKLLIDGIFNLFKSNKDKLFKRTFLINAIFQLVVSIISRCQKAYSYYYLNLLAFIKSMETHSGLVVILATISIFISLEQWDRIVGFFVDLLRLPNIFLLKLVSVVTPNNFFPQQTRTKYNSIIVLFKQLVIYEYSTTTDDESKKSLASTSIEVQKFWLNGQTVGNFQSMKDLQSVIELANQITDEYKSKNLKFKLDFLGKDLEMKYFIK